MNAISQMLKDTNREVNQVKTEIVNTESNTSVYTKSSTNNNTPVLTKFIPKVKDKTIIISLRISKKRLDKVDKLAKCYHTTRQAIFDTMIDNL